MRVLGFAGWSGSGKTTLLTAVLPLLKARGLSVSTIKHAHHGFEIDRPGKDSWRHREAGAQEVLVAGGRRWALLADCDEAPSLETLLGRLAPVDLVLVEGFKASPHDKIEVHRPALGHAPLWPGRDDIVAVACNAPPDAPCDRVLLPLDDPPAVADWLSRHVAERPQWRNRA